MATHNETATEQMVATIYQQGRTENAKYLKEKETQLNKEFEHQMTELTHKYQTQKERLTQSIEEEYSQKALRENNSRKQDLVQTKQNYLEKIFQAAEEEMNNWSAADFQAMMQEAFLKNELTGQILIKVGEHSQELLNSAIIDRWNEEQTGQLEFVLSQATIKNEGGFVLAQEGIEYNYLYSSLLEQVMAEQEFAIIAQLFADGSE